ncbi:MAG: iron dependent repressor, metal binding and dimerization domain protein [Anaerolineae bacterium]|jgi:DtxR family Mn-dependent transcriptional regulator
MVDWTTLLIGSVLLLFFALLWWPERGLYFRWRGRRRLDSRETIEDALMHVHQRQRERRPASTQSLAGTLGISVRKALALAEDMEAKGLVTVTGDDIRLSNEGRRWALQVVRAHRLFERYLADETSLPLQELHQHAHRLEHTLSPQELDKLEADLGYPSLDPHGDPIPTADGVLPPDDSQSLLEWPPGTPAQIVHIEDEPPQVFAQILAEGLALGTLVTVIESTPARIVFEANDGEHVLAPVVADNISVREMPEIAPAPSFERLTTLKVGQKARVKALDDTCQGLTRRRFLDLGVTPGVLIEPVMQSAFGEPTAYRVRDTLIALRHEQSDMILIEKNGR